MKRIVVDDEFGEIVLNVRANARRTTYSVSARQISICTHPQLFSNVFPLKDDIRQWIRTEKAKIEAKNPLPRFEFAPNFELETLNFVAKMVLDTQLKAPFAARRSGDLLEILYRSENDLLTPVGQQKVRHLITHFLTIDARNVLPLLVEKLAQKHHFAYNSVKVGHATTRWGSCSSRKVINLNISLLLLPTEQIEYVILHELCHTVEMNHGPKFHALLQSVLPNAKAIEREMKHQKIWNVK